MTVSQLKEKLNAVWLAQADGEREIAAFYVGDFLSNVMGRAPTDAAWLTVMTNVNVAGVAVLADIACVVICEGAAADDNLVARCKTQGINLIATALPLYEASLATVS